MDTWTYSKCQKLLYNQLPMSTHCSRTNVRMYRQEGEEGRVWGLRRWGMCEMGVWQGLFRGWGERVNGRWRWQETKAEITATALLVVIWLSAWKSFCSFQPSDYQQQMRQCNENQLTRAAQQNTDSKFTQKAAVHTETFKDNVFKM